MGFSGMRNAMVMAMVGTWVIQSIECERFDKCATILLEQDILNFGNIEWSHQSDESITHA